MSSEAVLPKPPGASARSTASPHCALGGPQPTGGIFLHLQRGRGPCPLPPPPPEPQDGLGGISPSPDG